MQMLLLENNGRGVTLLHSMRAEEVLTPDRVRILQRALLGPRLRKQQITPLEAGNFLRVRFPFVETAAESNRMIKLAKGAGKLTMQWTGWTIGIIAGASYQAANLTANVGRLAYRTIADSPVPGLVVRFPGVLIGSAVATQLWGTAMGSYVARQALRAANIRHFISVHRWLHLPASLRATFVLSGVRTSQYITSGIVPGLFTAWAIYDGYRLASFVYNQYYEQNMNSEQLYTERRNMVENTIFSDYTNFQFYHA